MRQIVLDTETTGLEVEQAHRLVELGCVEIVNRRITGRVFHRYLNPERDIDEGAQAVHGLSRAQLAGEPLFAAVHAEFLEFVQGAELIIHNAPFDLGFLNAELGRIGAGHPPIETVCRVLDTLPLARSMHPGQRNNLDALCKRYAIDNTQREYHGALLDARLLAEVYLAMTGGQAMLTWGNDGEPPGGREGASAERRPTAGRRIAVVRASEEELAAHEQVLGLLDRSSGGKTVWRRS